MLVLIRIPLQFNEKHIQSTLVISKGLPEILPDIRTSTYQICRIDENNKLNSHISQMNM